MIKYNPILNPEYIRALEQGGWMPEQKQRYRSVRTRFTIPSDGEEARTWRHEATNHDVSTDDLHKYAAGINRLERYDRKNVSMDSTRRAIDDLDYDLPGVLEDLTIRHFGTDDWLSVVKSLDAE